MCCWNCGMTMLNTVLNMIRAENDPAGGHAGTFPPSYFFLLLYSPVSLRNRGKKAEIRQKRHQKQRKRGFLPYMPFSLHQPDIITITGTENLCKGEGAPC